MTTTGLWSSGDAYERYMGRWSRAVAGNFIEWLRTLPSARWFEVGCGTGALTETILRDASPFRVVGIDPSKAFVQRARDSVKDLRVSFEVGDLEALGSVACSFDVVVSGLVLNFIPDTAEAVRRMSNAARVGGVVGAYVWDYAEGMQLLRHFWDAATALDSPAAELDEGYLYATCNPAALVELFNAELIECEVKQIVVPTVFKDFDDYWLPFTGGVGPAPAYLASIDEDQKAALQARLQDSLPRESDGSIRLTARAWAVRGTRAGS